MIAVQGAPAAPPEQAGRWRARPVVVIVLAVIAFLAATRVVSSPRQVGDGQEYVAQLIALRATGRPILDDRALAAFDAEVDGSNFLPKSDKTVLRRTLNAFSRGETRELPHFWFYSLLAFVVGLPLGITPLAGSISAPFLVLHAVLLCLLGLTAYRHAGARGALAAAALVVLSPVLWSVDKIHTELFTFCLSTMATIAVVRRDYPKAAFALALASTQNPPFAAVAALLGVVHLVRGAPRYRPADLAWLAAAGAVAALHPMYYLVRLGLPTPVLARGASFTLLTVGRPFLWWLDPDIGLLPNWPLGLLLLGLGAAGLWRRGLRSADPWVAGLCVFYVAFLSTAAATTGNLNSGGSRDVARYTLWFLCLFYPILVGLAARIANERPGRRALAAGLALAFLALNLRDKAPFLPSRANRPTALSVLIQTRLPWLYDPPAEIFLERYSGRGSPVWRTRKLIASTPDCEKMVVLRDIDRLIVPQGLCHRALDRDRLRSSLLQKSSGGRPADDPRFVYVTFTPAEVAALARSGEADSTSGQS